MLSPADLQAHYGAAEFGAFDDAHLERALLRARDTVQRYLPQPPCGSKDFDDAVLRIELTLARAYAHDEQRFDNEHPIVRELSEALDWLRRVADGRIRFCDTVRAPLAHDTRTSAPPAAFTAQAFERMP